MKKYPKTGITMYVILVLILVAIPRNEVLGNTSSTFYVVMEGSWDQKIISFNVPDNAEKIEVYLDMPSDSDFDLSIVDPYNRRTGGWTKDEDENSYEIPHSEYSGYSLNPEYVIVTDPTPGEWKVIVFSYLGAGNAKVTITIEGKKMPKVCKVVNVPSNSIYGLEEDMTVLLCISKSNHDIKGEVLRLGIVKNKKGEYYFTALPFFKFYYDINGNYESQYYQQEDYIPTYIVNIGYDAIHKIVSSSIKSHSVPTDLALDIIGTPVKFYVPTSETTINVLNSFYSSVGDLNEMITYTKVSEKTFNKVFG